MSANVDLPLEEQADELEQELAELEAFSVSSDFDTPYAAMARKSERFAELVTENVSVMMALRKVLHGMEVFASLHRCALEDLDVDVKMTYEGRIVITIRHD